MYENVEYQIKENWGGWKTVISASQVDSDQEISYGLDSLEKSFPDHRIRAWSRDDGIIDIR